MDSFSIILVVVLLILVILSAFFSGSETSIMALNQIKLDNAEKQGNKSAKIIKDVIDTEDDHVTSRILWLDGLELGRNKGEGIDSYNRYIYIHGTHEEGLIGQKASHGCIRMFNNDVIDLFDRVQEGTYVLIKA